MAVLLEAADLACIPSRRNHSGCSSNDLRPALQTRRQI